MANSNILIIRYTEALFECAQEKKLLNQIEADLESLEKAVSEPGIVSRLLLNSSVPRRIKTPLLDSVLKSLKLNQLTENFVHQLIKNNRVNLLVGIYNAFKELNLKEKGILSAVVRSAIVLDKKSLAEIQKELEKSLSKSVQINTEIDKTLLGGFSITVESRKIDCTLKTKMNKLKQQLAAVQF